MSADLLRRLAERNREQVRYALLLGDDVSAAKLLRSAQWLERQAERVPGEKAAGR